MHWSKSITVVGAHAEGEIGRVITAGVADIPGTTMRDKLRYLQNEYDGLRRFAMHEPRGCAQMTTNLLVPPCDPEADAAFIPMQADGSHAMSGSNAICVTTVLLETGILPMSEPVTEVVLDTILKAHKGQIVLVVGHSNTVPVLIANLGASKNVPAIAQGEFDNIYIISIPWFGKTKTIRLRYGEPYVPPALQ